MSELWTPKRTLVQCRDFCDSDLSEPLRSIVYDIEYDHSEGTATYHIAAANSGEHDTLMALARSRYDRFFPLPSEARFPQAKICGIDITDTNSRQTAVVYGVKGRARYDVLLSPEQTEQLVRFGAVVLMAAMTDDMMIQRAEEQVIELPAEQISGLNDEFAPCITEVLPER